MSSMNCPRCSGELVRQEESLLSVCSRCGFAGCMLDDIADEHREEIQLEQAAEPQIETTDLDQSVFERLYMCKWEPDRIEPFAVRYHEIMDAFDAAHMTEVNTPAGPKLLATTSQLRMTNTKAREVIRDLASEMISDGVADGMTARKLLMDAIRRVGNRRETRGRP